MTEETMSYKKFLSMYAKTHTTTYAQAMKECAGPDGVWAKYKAEHNITTKPRTRKPKTNSNDKVVNHPSEVDVAPTSKKEKVKTKPPKRKVVKVQAPPKGKKMVVSYVSESESEDDVEMEDPRSESDAEDIE